MKNIKKLFGGIELTWKKLIIFALISAVYTALMAIIPVVRNSSFDTITTTLEVWIFIGIFIIMNSKSNKDSALKCFIFFLISQPLIYLLQVPFSWRGWEIFQYYKYWFIWTILCLPLGYIGYYIKKGKWWGYLILLPMIILTAASYNTYLSYFSFCYPRYILICIFCVVAMIIYPNVLFEDKRIKIIGTIISCLIVVIITIPIVLNPHRYSTELLSNVDDKDITKDYQVSLKDEKYGDVYIEYVESIDSYMIFGDFKKSGITELIVKTPDGKLKEYDLYIDINSYTLEEKQ